jgi:hypothetical protein
MGSAKSSCSQCVRRGSLCFNSCPRRLSGAHLTLPRYGGAVERSKGDEPVHEEESNHAGDAMV